MVNFISESGQERGNWEDEPGRGATSVSVSDVLGRVFTNMPWTYIDRYMDFVLDRVINIEIGFGAEELDKTPVGDIASVVGRLHDRGCRTTVHGPFWDLCPGSVDAGIREVSRSRLVRLFEVLEYVRPEQIVCHTGFDSRHHRGHRATFIENSVSVWEHFAKQAEGLGAPLLLENVWEEDPELHLEIFEKIGSPWFGFCLDTGHQHAFSKTSLAGWLEATAGHLKEIHLHDNDGSFDHHLPPGRGNIDFDFLFGFLDANGLRPVLTLEPHGEEHLHQSLDALSHMESFAKIL